MASYFGAFFPTIQAISCAALGHEEPFEAMAQKLQKSPHPSCAVFQNLKRNPP